MPAVVLGSIARMGSVAAHRRRLIAGAAEAAGGTPIQVTLATAFGTWRVRGLNPFAECHRLLSAPTSPASR